MTLPTPRRAAQPTLVRHLLAWALGALVLVWVGFILFGYLAGEHEADELTDGHLASVSALLLPLAQGEPHRLGGDVGSAVKDWPQGVTQLRAHDYQHSMSVLAWDAQGRLRSRLGDAPPAGFDSPDGFATLRLGEPPRLWRTFTRWDEARVTKLMVLVSVRERDDLATDIAAQVIEPGLWMLPVVALVLGLAIHRGLKPLRVLADEVHALDIHGATGLARPAGYEELQATVEAINLLVDRYHAALARERVLANEFAHELRTPLASLALLARTAREAQDGAARQAALANLEAAALRAGEVLSHLLALARASRAELDEASVAVDLEAVAARVVADFAPAAHAGGRELGLESGGPVWVMGHAPLLELALRNLVENALAHTPPGTQVAVELVPEGPALLVSDDGEGRLAAAGPVQQDAVRPLRLGLGLQVVAKVAAIHGAQFDAEVRLPGARRGWRIQFPGNAGAPTPLAGADPLPAAAPQA